MRPFAPAPSTRTAHTCQAPKPTAAGVCIALGVAAAVPAAQVASTSAADLEGSDHDGLCVLKQRLNTGQQRGASGGCHGVVLVVADHLLGSFREKSK